MMLAAAAKRNLLNQSKRFMSVISLSNEDAVEKFHTLNSKSVLYFTASWCPPCKMIGPVYENLSKEHSPEVAFGKVDVDDNQNSALEYEISAVPTFVFFEGDKVVNRFSGADETQLNQLISSLKEA